MRQRRNTIALRLLYLLIGLATAAQVSAQCGTITKPVLFGNSQTSIYCKGQNIEIGVSNPVTPQTYDFSLYRNGVQRKKGGPLSGGGQSLSVSAAMRSAQDAGEYRIRTYDACGNKDSVSYFAFYGAIDNLSIVSWGNTNVKFNWAASGPPPAQAGDHITYDYVVTTRSNPDLVSPDSILFVTDTFAVVSDHSLANGVTYYIHVRVDLDQQNNIVYHGNPVFDQFGCAGSELPWQTIRFVSCSSTSATLGSVSPVNAILCSNNNVTLTATGGSTYKWFKEDGTQISGQTAATYVPTAAGQFRSYITTATTCQGMQATSTVISSPIKTSHLFGAGDFYAGDTVKLWVDSTAADQTYQILKDGVSVYSFAGIGVREFANLGDPQNRPDTVPYKFVMSPSTAGLYTVRTSSAACSSVDFGNAQVNLISGVTICPNASTSFSFLSTGNNTTFKWQVDQGSGYTNITNGGVYGGATTKTLTITGAPATMYGYKYQCVCTGGVGVTSSPRTLRFGMTWTGASSTVFGTAGNWSCNVVPTSNLDLIIPPTGNQPIVNANISVHSVTLKSGATLNVSGSNVKLTVTGQ